MKVQCLNIDMELLGAQFMNMDSNEQSAFFRGMVKEARTWKSNYKCQMQFAIVAGELKKDEREDLDNTLGMITPEKV